MSQLEPYLSDQEVSTVATKIIDEHPILQRYNSDFVTARIEPPWHGQLPDGRIGWTNHPVVQFIIVSDHPRSNKYKLLGAGSGTRHTTVAAAWERAYEDAAKEHKHLVSSDQMSPLERIFRGVTARHIEQLESLASIIN